MPERNPTRSPTFIAGTVLESGTPNTGQQTFTDGGSRTFQKLSGTAGGDANIWVGAGRLDAALLHPELLAANPAASGVTVLFYDSAAAVSGGPLTNKIVGVLRSMETKSGQVQGGQVSKFGFVFTSGLCHTSASGMPGFTASYTPVISG